MSNEYRPVLWNRQKKWYDFTLLTGILIFSAIFVILQLTLFPAITSETLLIRLTGTLAFVLLHIILSIGPLCRLNSKFLPLLYNRRHLGVTMFIIATIHGVFNILQFHSLGNVDPLVSLFTSNTDYLSLVNFPFQTLGFLALIILFLMASTSHDFWLNTLSPKVWKALHMMVYFAYGLLVMHVMLGAVQDENSPLWYGVIGIGLALMIGLHLTAATKERKNLKNQTLTDEGEFITVCKVEDIEPNRAKIFVLRGENIAVFKYKNQLSAVNNICKHQNGPLGEGKIVDGCITCPWHGYQYLPHNGQSPPPFTEKLATYDVKIQNGMVMVNPIPHPEGTALTPATITLSIP